MYSPKQTQRIVLGKKDIDPSTLRGSQGRPRTAESELSYHKSPNRIRPFHRASIRSSTPTSSTRLTDNSFLSPRNHREARRPACVPSAGRRPKDSGGQVGGRLHRAFNFGASYMLSQARSSLHAPTFRLVGWKLHHECYPARLTAGGRAGISEVLFGHFLFKERVADAPSRYQVASHFSV
jgi:hypothetical protein